MHPRVSWRYLIACADVHRLDRQDKQALEFAEKRFEFARKNKLVHETSKANLAKFEEYKPKTVESYMYLNSEIITFTAYN